LEQLLIAAVRAPDHGILRPWRFLILTGKQREQSADIFVAALRKDNPTLSTEAAADMAKKPLRAPMIIVAVAELEEHHKIPLVDQILATGAAVQNMLIGALAYGIGGTLRTAAT